MTKVTKPVDYKRRKFIAGALGLAATGVFANARYADAGIFSDLFGGSNTGRKPIIEAPEAGEAPRAIGQTSKLGATTYNNAYEFGLTKTAPAKHAHKLNLENWTVTLHDKDKKMTFGVEDLMGMPFSHLPEHVYRMRCVEGWSVVVPWNGIPLSTIIKKFAPNSSAKYVRFVCINRPEEMPGQASVFSSLDWPYEETLTMEEAMNPLTLATFGAYGDSQLAQNGMPLKVNVPWKYGYKSPKFVAAIEFVEERPTGTWTRQSAREYGWYSNVYPLISHPRWSQATERRIWDQGDIQRIQTEAYNGYEAEVAHMYPGEQKRWR